ncbi:MAG: chitobiase/beta-hexosaminidase C-terminal domain-containing protein [Bacteroidales bacterium]
MKKFLLSLFSLLFSVCTLNAAEVSFAMQDLTWTPDTHAEYGTGYQLTGATGLQIGYWQATSADKPSTAVGSYVPVQQNHVMTLATVSGADITKVVVTSQKPTRTSGIYFNSVLVAASGSTVTWEGNAATLKMKFSGLSHVTNITIVYDDSKVEQVALPTFNPESGTYFEPFLFSAETTTEGATIQYSIDGGDFTAYTAPFEISTACTVRVKAVKEGYTDSDVAVATYKFRVRCDVASIAEALTHLDTEEVVRFSRPVIVTYQTSSQFYTYVRDESGSTLIVGTLPKYESGDSIPAGFMGKMIDDHSQLKLTTSVSEEFKTGASFGEAIKGTAAAAPEVMDKTADPVTADQNRFVVFNMVLFDNTELSISNGTKLAITNYFNTELPESGMYNVAGILSVWNDVVSFYPTAFYDPTTGIAATRIDTGATAAPKVFDLSGRRTTMNAKGLKIVRQGGKTKKMF